MAGRKLAIFRLSGGRFKAKPSVRFSTWTALPAYCALQIVVFIPSLLSVTRHSRSACRRGRLVSASSPGIQFPPSIRFRRWTTQRPSPSCINAGGPLTVRRPNPSTCSRCAEQQKDKVRRGVLYEFTVAPGLTVLIPANTRSALSDGAVAGPPGSLGCERARRESLVSGVFPWESILSPPPDSATALAAIRLTPKRGPRPARERSAIRLPASSRRGSHSCSGEKVKRRDNYARRLRRMERGASFRCHPLGMSRFERQLAV